MPDVTNATPPVATRRERKRMQTRRSLYDAAVELFLEKGYEATTMDEIAELADTSRATAYNYFPRKSNFLDEWTERRRQKVEQDLLPASADSQPIGEVLRLYVNDLARINIDEEALTRTLLPAWVRAGGPIDAAPQLADVLLQYIRTGQERGELRLDCDGERAAHLIRNAYLGNLYLWLHEDQSSDFDLQSALEESIDILLRGLAN